MAHLELVALIVREYDPAIRFFVDVLNFELVEDLTLQLRLPSRSPSPALGVHRPCVRRIHRHLRPHELEPATWIVMS